MTDNKNRTESDRRAIEACREVREDAVKFLASINSGADSYFDRQPTRDLDMTSKQAEFFQSVIDRMNIAIRLRGAHSGRERV